MTDPNHLASSAGLLNRLNTRPCQLLLLDEIGDLMGSLKNKNDVAKNDLPKILKSLYSSTGRGEVKAYADSKNNVNVSWHHLSFYATGVPGDFWRNLTASDVTGGFITRALLFSLDLLSPFPKDHVDFKPPQTLVDAIKRLHLLERKHLGDLRTTPIPVRIDKAPEAKTAFTRWHREYHELQNKHRNAEDGRAAIYARVAENAHKLALIHAVSQTGGIPAQVSMESVTFALQLMDWMTPRFVDHVAANISHNEQDALRKRILRIVDRRGSVSKRDIYNNLNGCTPKMAEDALRILEESGDLVPTTTTKNSGRVSLVWTRPEKGDDDE